MNPFISLYFKSNAHLVHFSHIQVMLSFLWELKIISQQKIFTDSLIKAAAKHSPLFK